MTVTPQETKANARWLAQAVKPWRKSAMLANALVIADVVPATGFAAGLALSLGALVNALPWNAPDSLSVSEAVRLALPGATLAVGSLMARAGLGYLATRKAAALAHDVKSGLRQRFMGGLFTGKLDDSAAMTAAVEGIDALDGYMARFMPARQAAAIAPLVMIGVAACVSPFTAGILIFTLLPFVIGMILTGMAAATESRRQFQAMERLSGLFVDRIRNLPAILVFQAEDSQTRAIGRAAHELANRTSRVLKVAFLSSAILEFFSALAVALVAVYCGFNLLRILPFPAPDTLSLAQAFFLLAIAPEVYQPMRRLAAAYHDRQAAEAAVPHLQALEAAAPEPRTTAPAPSSNAPAISFRNVGIAYTPSVPVVRDFNLSVQPGQTVALLGPSGSGKSSLIHLLLGLSPLTQGHIEVDGHPLDASTDFSAWIAYAGQSPMVIPGTLSDNIALANPSASTRQIMEAASMAGLSGDLDRVIDERGGGLSGGERRRLGLARAFLKPAPILLLDEPTAHLDHYAEQTMLSAIVRAAQGRTTLIATHSDAVADLAHVIVRL